MRLGFEPLTISNKMTLPPTRLCIIGHLAVMTALLAIFTVQSCSDFVKYGQFVQFASSSPSLGFSQMNMGILDSYCHLAKLLSRKDMTLLDLVYLQTDITNHLPYVIANYVFPQTWDFIGDHVQ